MCRYVCICAYIYIYIYIYSFAAGLLPEPLSGEKAQRPENMAGVSMVSAEFAKFKHGLHKSCGIECLEGMMLEPCLLQPCFHVAGRRRARAAAWPPARRIVQ